jgi:transcriptional regulator with XRE-family HTH domain
MNITLEEMKSRLPAERRARIEVRADEIENEIKGLQALRLARASTQVDLANRLHISQASVAKIEKRTNMLLSTLREYIQGLGGELDLVVRFENERMPLNLNIFTDDDLMEPVRPPMKKTVHRGHKQAEKTHT